MSTLKPLKIYPQLNSGRGMLRPEKPTLACFRRMSIWIALVLVTLLLNGCVAKREAAILTVGAASSLTEPLSALAKAYTEKTGVQLQVSFASSGTLRRQVEEGAPFDLMILASETDYRALTSTGRLVESREATMLGNTLCFVSKTSADLETLGSLINSASRIALGDPVTVPVGQYAAQALDSLGLTSHLEGKALYAKDAQQVLQYLNTGAVEAGILFATDTRKLEGHFFILPLPESLHQPIRYPAALVAESQHQEEAQRFLEYLLQPESLDHFTAMGFTRPE